MKKEKSWARLLAYITGLVSQELLLQNEYLAAENRILRAHLPVFPIASVRPGTRDTGRNRQEVGTQGSDTGGCCRETGYDSRVVPAPHRSEVRRLEAPCVPGSPANHSGCGGPHRADGTGKFWLGIRPHCRCPGRPKSH